MSVTPVEDTFVEHIIYAPVPYKGYALRARSRGASVESFTKAFREWFIPFDQTIIDGDFLEKVLVVENDKIYLARVFHAPGLDELKRSGAVSHIAQLDVSQFSQNPLNVVDEAMAMYIRERGIPIGEIEPLNVKIERGDDLEYKVIRETILKETIQRIIKLTHEDRFKIFVVYKGPYRDLILFGLTRILSAASPFARRGLIVASENIKSDVLLLYNGVVIVGKRLPPWARLKGWNVINLEKQDTTIITSEKTIEDVLRQIYG